MQVILNIHLLVPLGIMVMEKAWKLFSIFNDFFSTKQKKKKPVMRFIFSLAVIRWQNGRGFFFMWRLGEDFHINLSS